MEKPLLVYDGGCKFCVQQVENIEKLLGPRFEKISFREENFFKKYPQLSPEQCEKAVQLLMPSGQKFAGAEAMAQLVGLSVWFMPLKWIYYVPGLRNFWNWLYANVSLHRYKLSYWVWRR